MKRGWLSKAIPIVLLLIMAISVPSRADFDEMLETKIHNESDGLISGLLAEAGLALASTRYHNYVFVATAEMHLGEYRAKYVGLLGNWFLISEHRSN